MLRLLRQLVVIVRDREEAVRRWGDLFGLQPCARRELGEYGLINAILPLRDTFIEFVQPVDSTSPAARFLERRGEGIYMLVFQVEDRDGAVADLQSKGLIITGTYEEGGAKTAFVHPRSFFGAFLSLTQPTDRSNPWPDAGPGWRRYSRGVVLKDLRCATLAVRDLGGALVRAHQVFDLLPTEFYEMRDYGVQGAYLPLGRGRWYGRTFLEFMTPTTAEAPSARFLERRGEGPYMVTFDVADLDGAVRRAEAGGAKVVGGAEERGFRLAWLHPKSVNGVFIELHQVTTRENPWPRGGDDWWKRRR